jgi:hypothetical protein
MLASLLYPYDDDAKGNIDTWLAELETEHCIRRYEANGDSYIEVCNWLQHQKIDKPSKSKFPSFDDSSRIVANPREGSSEDQGSRTKDQGPKEGSTPPAEKQFNPVEVAIVICRELGFAGRDIRLLIEEQITNEIHRLPGTQPQQVGQAMADQWRLYQRSAEWKTQFKKSPKSFFSSPAWKDSPDQWERSIGKPAVSTQADGVNAIERTYSQASALKTATMLMIAADTLSKEISQAETKLWTGLLSQFPADVIEQAFVEHLRLEKFFPKPAEIIERSNSIMRVRREQREAEERRRELAERKRAVLRGEIQSADVPKLIEEARERVGEKQSEAARARIAEDQQRRYRANQVILAYQFIEQLKQNLGA